MPMSKQLSLEAKLERTALMAAAIKAHLEAAAAQQAREKAYAEEPLAELRGRVNFGLIGSGFRETSYPVCGTSPASAYSHCKNAEGTDDVSQRDTFHILGSPASGASALAGRGPGRPADAPPQAVGCSAGLDPDRGVAALLAGPGGAPACRTSGSGSRLRRQSGVQLPDHPPADHPARQRQDVAATVRLAACQRRAERGHLLARLCRVC